jgi:transposase, IS5 family
VKKQLTLASNEFERFRKPTRREKFLAEMNTVVPWAELAALIEPYYPKVTSVGGPPAGRAGADAAHSLPATVV